jgi:hypothetical protein
MGVSQEQLNRAVTAARAREAQGYFGKVKAGDQRAASLFARLVAFDLNPTGSLQDYGWLSKSPGETQVDGYAEDAIVFTANQADLLNVVDLVNGAGAPGASIGGAVKERRASNLWVKPKPLTQEETDYLFSGSTPIPQPSPALKPRDQFYAEFQQVNDFYIAPEGLQRIGGMVKTDNQGRTVCDSEAMGAWGYDLMTGKTVEQVKTSIRHSGEWQSKHPGETPF